MGVSTNCKITFFNKEKNKISKIELGGRADDFIYNLMAEDAFLIGESTFNPCAINNFTDEEKEMVQIYFDEKSLSVLEEYAIVKQNIQDPIKLKIIWEKIRSGIIKEFRQSMKDYHENLLIDPKTKMSEYNFSDKIFRYTWSLDCISEIIGVLQVAIKNENLIEITASDM